MITKGFIKGPFNNYVDKMRGGERGSKFFFSILRTVDAGGGGTVCSYGFYADI